MDVKSVSLNGKLEEEIFLEQQRFLKEPMFLKERSRI